MGYTDLGDSLEDMKIRAEHRPVQLPVPLRRRDAGGIAAKYGPVATPHMFVFDQERKLRYHGPHRQQSARGLRQGRRRAERARCGARRHARAGREDADRRLLDQVARKKALARRREEGDREGAGDAREGRRRRARGACQEHRQGKTLLVNFWATWCAPCIEEFPELQATWRMYRKRPFEIVTVAINYPGRGSRRPQVPRRAARDDAQPAVRRRWIRTS